MLCELANRDLRDMFEVSISRVFDKSVLIERISIKVLPEAELVVRFDISAVIFSTIAFFPEYHNLFQKYHNN